MCAGRFGLGWVHDVFTIACHMFMHTYLHFCILWYWFVWYFSVYPSLSLSLFLSFFLFLLLIALWHLSENLLCPGTLFIPRHFLLILLHLMSSSMMIKLIRTFRRTFHDATFIRNARSFYWIFLILTFPLSSTVGIVSHYVASRSLALPWGPTSTEAATDQDDDSSGFFSFIHIRSFFFHRWYDPRCNHGAASAHGCLPWHAQW